MEEKIPVCPNCGKGWQKGDKYCRYCGSPISNPRFVPVMMADLYGPPPVRRKHICTACDYAWETYAMVDEERYCPRCGGAAPTLGNTGVSICFSPPASDRIDDEEKTQPIRILPEDFWIE